MCLKFYCFFFSAKNSYDFNRQPPKYINLKTIVFLLLSIWQTSPSVIESPIEGTFTVLAIQYT